MPSTFIWTALVIAGLWAVALVLGRRNRRARLRTLRAEWGVARIRQRDMTAIAAYARGIAGSETVLDDRTWSDLNMDNVFSVLDRTESVVGQQVLYARLRSGRHTEDLSAFEALVTHAGGLWRPGAVLAACHPSACRRVAGQPGGARVDCAVPAGGCRRWMATRSSLAPANSAHGAASCFESLPRSAKSMRR